MTVQAVIDEHLRAALKGYCITRIGIGAIELDVRTGCKCNHGQEQKNDGKLSHDVTLSGSGLVRSIFVYQGISRKNRK